METLSSTSTMLPATPLAGETPCHEPVILPPQQWSRSELRRRVRAAIVDLEAARGSLPVGARPEPLLGLAPQAVPTPVTRIVTPGLAKLLLGFNGLNRDIDPAVVENYARLMIEGQWRMVSGAISFTCDGQIGNGQHRLLGVVVSGTPAEFLLVFGMPANSIFAEDRGKKRTLADDLGLDGYGSGLNGQQKIVLAAAGRLVWHLDNGRVPWANTPFPTERDLLSSLKVRHPTVKEAARDYYASCRYVGLAPAVAAAFFGLFAEADRAKGETFARRLTENEGLTHGTTLHTLHRLCTGSGSKKRVANRSTQMVLLVRGWNNYRAGREVVGLHSALKDGAFPRIEGLHYDDGGRLQLRR